MSKDKEKTGCDQMTAGERFLATMLYQERDRAPIRDFGFWDETLEAWQQDDNFPKEVTNKTSDVFFGMDPDFNFLSFTCDLRPRFPKIVIEDRGDSVVLQEDNGVRVLAHKKMSSIPQHMGHLLTDRDSWEKHYKPKLDPESPERIPTNLPEPHLIPRDRPLVLDGGSLYGWIRNWMGVEEASYLVYDDPTLFEEIVTTIADCIVGVHEKAYAMGIQFDVISMWEDMCFSNGPLLSPQHFKTYLLPQYKRITELGRKHGVEIVILDSDGKIDDLIPLWLEGGVNCLYPIEIGTWQADPVRLRQTFGKDLRMMGGFSKQILAGKTEDIEKEIRRLIPLVEEGGYIGFCDHRVPPNVSLSNYLFFVDRIRALWGHNRNLRPIHPSIQALASSPLSTANP